MSSLICKTSGKVKEMFRYTYLPNFLSIKRATIPETRSTNPDITKLMKGSPPILPVFIVIPQYTKPIPILVKERKMLQTYTMIYSVLNVNQILATSIFKNTKNEQSAIFHTIDKTELRKPSWSMATSTIEKPKQMLVLSVISSGSLQIQYFICLQ